jgi:hypothetical protein
MRTQTVLLWISLSLMVGLSACDWTSSSPVASLRRATGWPFGGGCNGSRRMEW